MMFFFYFTLSVTNSTTGVENKEFSKEYVSEMVLAMYGEATDKDIVLYQKAHMWAEGNERLARIVFNQLRSKSLVHATYVEIID